MVHRIFLPVFLAPTVIFAGVQPTLAATPDFQYDVALTTDYMYRGVSQTRSAPAIHAAVSMDTESGWYGWLWASNIDYYETPQPDDGARIEVDLLLGYQRPIGDRIKADLAVVRYTMPGTFAGIDYDYSEWIATAMVDDRHTISVAYSNDVFSSGAAGWHYLVSTSIGLPQECALELQLGSVDLRDAYEASYQYADIALLRNFGRLSARLDYFHTSSDAKRIFDESLVTPRVALTLGVSFN
jgi:uncharacterized protein (TIGR02001 family)